MVKKFPVTFAAMRKPSGPSGTFRSNKDTLGKAPCVAAVITGSITDKAIRKAASSGAGLLEIRVDTFAALEPGKLTSSFEKLKKNTDLPILLTIRSAKEGGLSDITEKQRASLYFALTPFADLIDIELGSSGIRKNVVNFAKRAKKRIIVSHHDFESTPGDRKLKKIIESSRAEGGDIVKIASMVNSREDFRRLAALVCSEKDLIVIGMGELGKPSRVFFPMLGSLVTYCPVTRGTAPGQLSLSEMRSELRRYGF